MPTKPLPGDLSIEMNPTPPAALGFSMPAEWEKHASTWLAWPHNPETWPGKRLARVEETYLQMLEGLLPHEKVNLLVQEEAVGSGVKKRLEKMSIRTVNLILHAVPTADVWIRDYGPTFITVPGTAAEMVPGTLRDRSLRRPVPAVPGTDKAWIKWRFNAWGGKYPSLEKDTHVFENKSLIPHSCFELGIVLEGGSIEVNGAGTCLTTEQCLLNKNRNPQLSRKQIETFLKDYLGVSHILWLEKGIAGDDTDGHIDDTCRFVDASTILTVLEEDWRMLQNAVDQDGKKWKVVKLPALHVANSEPLPASYANFYIANKAVLLPVYGDKNDKEAVRILKDFFPKREILPIFCNDLVCGLGALHCVTQQEPA